MTVPFLNNILVKLARCLSSALPAIPPHFFSAEDVLNAYLFHLSLTTHLKSQQPPEVPLLLPRPLEGTVAATARIPSGINPQA